MVNHRYKRRVCPFKIRRKQTNPGILFRLINRNLKTFPADLVIPIQLPHQMLALNASGSATAAKNFLRDPVTGSHIVFPKHDDRQVGNIRDTVYLILPDLQQITIGPVKRVEDILIFPDIHRNTFKVLFVYIVYSAD